MLYCVSLNAILYAIYYYYEIRFTICYIEYVLSLNKL